MGTGQPQLPDAKGVQTAKSTLIPEVWDVIYVNPLAEPEHIAGFRMEGEAAVTFPLGRMRLESVRDESEGQRANFVLWCPEDFPADVAVSWEFWPVREPGLAIMFFSANGTDGRDLFDPSIKPRTGEYDQYHHGEINAFHVSYFRRKWAEERKFHTCNLRKSYGFHLVAQGADPIPGVMDAAGPYRMLIVKNGPCITFAVNDLPVFSWKDDGETYGPPLAGGKLGFRQMAPLIGEYANVAVYAENGKDRGL
ncbi:DUF1961 family protein [Paenibacillus cookii]|uniref:DUF1961 family protein n=1 Tax=Paenibacillus cookii TaxID=157839 RepID=A0ABQ4M1E0_9BACL|nr:DUF1961 family protein [Paenibacillus cookii]GIO68761.1 hypothetical protein J21TS3_35820 [Paenibacillus cookii]